MQIIVYLDVFWVTNCLISEVILVWVGYFLKKKINVHRMILAGICGGFCATASLVLAQVTIENKMGVFVKIVCNMVLFVMALLGMPYIAFGRCTILQWKNLLFQMLSAIILLAGILSFSVSKQELYLFDSTRFFTMSMWELLIKCVVFLSIMPIYNWILEQRKQTRSYFYRIELEYRGIKQEGVGFLDTGNGLKSPFSKKPIAIAQDCFLKPFLEEKEYNLLKEIQKCQIMEQQILGHFILVPYHSVGRSMGVLPCLRFEHLRVWNGDCVKDIPNALIAFCNENISNNGDYQVILHVEHVE